MKFQRLMKDGKILASRRRTTPSVSIVMPVFRLRDGMTEAAISSVLDQSHDDFELVLIDDGSVDGTFELLKSIQRSDPRVMVLRHEQNCGLPAARVNEGILLSTGRYLCYQFEDDSWDRSMIEALLRAKGSSDHCFVYGIAEARSMDPRNRRAIFIGDEPFDYNVLTYRNTFANNAVLHSRSLIEEVGLYDPHLLLRRFCDYDLWLRMVRRVEPIWCPEIVSQVNFSHRHSIGVNASFHEIQTRLRISSDRDARLLPSAIADFDIFEDASFRNQADADWFTRTYVAPFVAQYPYLFTKNERIRNVTTRARRNNIVVSKGTHSTSVDITMHNFRRALPTAFNSQIFVPEMSLAPYFHEGFIDTAVFHRTTTKLAETLISSPKRAFTAIYAMDDDMLHYHEIGPEHAYLAPGTPTHDSVKRQIEQADGIFVYSDSLARAIRPINPRVFRLETNIRSCHVESALPSAPRDRKKFAIITSGIRIPELKRIWPEVTEFAERHAEEIEFHFWGFDHRPLPPLGCPVFSRPFVNNYASYLRELAVAGFHFILCPLDDTGPAKRCKSPVKYLEATVAGAVLIASEGDPYAVVRNGVNGIKASFRKRSWLKALEVAHALTEEERGSLFRSAREDVLRRYTTESQLLGYVQAFSASTLHHLLGSRRAPGGRASIAYFVGEHLLGGATLHILQHARLLAALSFRVIVCAKSGTPDECALAARARQLGLEFRTLPYHTSVSLQDSRHTDPDMEREIEAFIREHAVRLVHGTPYSRTWVSACRRQGVPVVLSLHQNYTPFGFTNSIPTDRKPHAVHCSSTRYANEWSAAFDVPIYSIPAPVPNRFFLKPRATGIGRRKTTSRILVSGTLQPRKGQLKAIEAVAELRRIGHAATLVLAGYDNLAVEYAAQCRARAEAEGILEAVDFLGFVDDMESVYRSADLLLCASDDESQPQAVINAMALGVPVVVTPVGGVRELVRDGYSGIIAEGFDVAHLVAAMRLALTMDADDRERIVACARDTVRSLCLEDVVRLRLLELYQAAVGTCRSEPRIAASGRAVRFSLIPGNGGPVAVSRIFVDGREIDQPAVLPPGWRLSTAADGTSHLASTATLPIGFDVFAREAISIELYSGAGSGAIHLKSAGFETSLSVDLPGTRVFTFPLELFPDATPATIVRPAQDGTARSWEAGPESLADALPDPHGLWGQFDGVISDGGDPACIGWAALAHEVLVSTVDGRVLGRATTGHTRPDLASYFGDDAAVTFGWRAVLRSCPLEPGTHPLVAYRKPHTKGPLIRLPGVHGIQVTAAGQATPLEAWMAGISTLRQLAPIDAIPLTHGRCDDIRMEDGGGLQATGWVRREDGYEGFSVVLLVGHGDRIRGWGLVCGARPDVARHFGCRQPANWGWHVVGSGLDPGSDEAIRIFAADLLNCRAAAIQRSEPERVHRMMAVASGHRP